MNSTGDRGGLVTLIIFPQDRWSFGKLLSQSQQTRGR